MARCPDSSVTERPDGQTLVAHQLPHFDFAVLHGAIQCRKSQAQRITNRFSGLPMLVMVAASQFDKVPNPIPILRQRDAGHQRFASAANDVEVRPELLEQANVIQIMVVQKPPYHRIAVGCKVFGWPPPCMTACLSSLAAPRSRTIAVDCQTGESIGMTGVLGVVRAVQIRAVEHDANLDLARWPRARCGEPGPPDQSGGARP